MKKIIFIFFYFSLFTFHLLSQSITWQRLYNIPGASVSYSYATCHADSGNFYSGGHAFITNLSDYRMCVMKLNPYGDTIWTRIIDTLAIRIYAMSSTGDGGCVFTGDNNFSIKLSSSGSIVWVKYYGTIGGELYDIIKTSDGGYIACGSLYDVNNFTYNGYLIKLDVNGNMQWYQIYPSTDIKDLNSIIQMSDGNYAIAGTNSDFFGDTIKILFLKVNPSGGIILEKRYSVLGKGGAGMRINQVNGQFIIGGNSRNLNLNACFIRIDTSGNLLFAKRYEANRLEVFYDMKIINTNKYIFTRQRELMGINQVDSYVMIIDSVGNSFIEKVFSLDEVVSFWSILLMPNGDFVFAGDGRDVLSSPYRTFIVRADSNLYAPPIGITNSNSNIPFSYILKQNYPNPFNPITEIKYELPKNAYVTVKVYNAIGELVSTLINNEYKTEGSYTVKFDGSNYASGIYFYSLETKDYKETKKMVLIK